jgi:hypothetical protein
MLAPHIWAPNLRPVHMHGMTVLCARQIEEDGAEFRFLNVGARTPNTVEYLFCMVAPPMLTITPPWMILREVHEFHAYMLTRTQMDSTQVQDIMRS